MSAFSSPKHWNLVPAFQLNYPCEALELQVFTRRYEEDSLHDLFGTYLSAGIFIHELNEKK